MPLSLDGELYSRWLQVPVTIDGDQVLGHARVGHRGARTLRVRSPAPADRDELGLRRRQRAGARAPCWPAISVWLIPRVTVAGSSCTRLVNTRDQAQFLAGAWAMVLGRLKANLVAALAGTPPPGRVRRRKSDRIVSAS